MMGLLLDAKVPRGYYGIRMKGGGVSLLFWFLVGGRKEEKDSRI